MKLFRILLEAAWPTIVAAAIAGLLNGGSTAALIALINAALQKTPALQRLLPGGFILLGTLLLLTHFTSQVLLVRAAQQAVYEMRLLLSRQILASPLRQLEAIGNPQLLATLTEDVDAVSRSFSVLPNLFNAIAIVIGCLIYMGWLSPPLFFALVALIAIGTGSYLFLAGRAQKFLERARQQQDHLFHHFRTLTEGNKELKLNRQRRLAFFYGELTPTAQKTRQQNELGYMVFAIAASWGQLLLFVTIGFFLFTLPHLLGATPTVLSGYVLTIIYLMLPMQQVIDAIPVFSRARVALKKVESLQLSLGDLRQDINNRGELPPFGWKTLSLLQICHQYRGSHKDEPAAFTLGPLSLTIEAGELVFIVGGNGSGKSTLAKIITGLYMPDQGEIWVDDHCLQPEDYEWYRQHFAAVFSDFYLFDSLLGIESPERLAVIPHYLEKLRLSHKVRLEGNRFSTTSLSQGERKRLALLMAYLDDRPAYLFDEWAADQDPVFRDIFYRQLLPELKAQGKTVFVISHDDRYFDIADRLIKLDYGQLVVASHP
ncbi:ABC-type cyclic peptide export system ATPase component [Thermosynechococcus sp. NK55a]|uniref:cyclic peptide export ABC transporter n=1 Tax=unclassified Thermosynechococcus TaxID=2622553 RepID=UPI0003D8B773|nr:MULTISPECIES: cyclic peptide export ABC transporter [unclassified Thermosynechococcus]AHB88297.1 ABC-type cyclic peptide export system ATPase component [Thermosynechococcus sp. NK55a]RMH66851.1 MAG: cyclic peptide export ABC transporter [Cyanobacteria bacterium J003]HIK24167.1 cyclic peptide export ABC transporter [Thermosynechococcus sp. M3746_W2019_013]